MSDRPRVEVDGEAIVVTVPMKLRRRSGRREVHVPGCGLPRSTAKRTAPNSIVLALARAHHWQELVESGEYRSTSELADALGVDRSYVSRIMRLTSLEPDIVEALVQDDGSTEMSLARLLKLPPQLWHEQRSCIGGAPRIAILRHLSSRTP